MSHYLRLIEHYTSTQGEGPRVGALTQFVRFAGCNLRCPLWPCDSQFAIDPKLYRDEQRQVYPNVLAQEIIQMSKETGAQNICLTGGEPFLQNGESLEELVRVLARHSTSRFSIEAFTNGTYEIPEWAFELGIHPVMDWKLPGSGEKTFLASRSRNVRQMQRNSMGCVKFTVKDVEDFSVAVQVYETMIKDFDVPVYVGAVWSDTWGPKDVLRLMKLHKVSDWRLNVQVHNFIYGAQTRRT